MNFNKKDLVYIMLFIILFYLIHNTKEKFAANNIKSLMNKGVLKIPGSIETTGNLKVRGNVNVGSLIKFKSNGEIWGRDIHGYSLSAKTIYSKGSSDMEAIRNLSELANNLTKNGKLVVPGGLEIKGRLTVNGPTNLNGGTNVKAAVNFWKPVAFKNQKSKGWSMINHPKGYCSITVPFNAWKTSQLRGNVTMGSNLKVNSEIHGRDIHGYSVNAKKGGLNASYNLYVGGSSYVKGTSHLNGNVGIRVPPHSSISLRVNRNKYRSLYVDGDLLVKGDTETQNLLSYNYIGAHNEIATKRGLYSACKKMDGKGGAGECGGQYDR